MKHWSMYVILLPLEEGGGDAEFRSCTAHRRVFPESGRIFSAFMWDLRHY
jgi:hypothetical protein